MAAGIKKGPAKWTLFSLFRLESVCTDVSTASVFLNFITKQLELKLCLSRVRHC